MLRWTAGDGAVVFKVVLLLDHEEVLQEVMTGVQVEDTSTGGLVGQL